MARLPLSLSLSELHYPWSTQKLGSLTRPNLYKTCIKKIKQINIWFHLVVFLVFRRSHSRAVWSRKTSSDQTDCNSHLLLAAFSYSLQQQSYLLTVATTCKYISVSVCIYNSVYKHLYFNMTSYQNDLDADKYIQVQ